jgi:2,3-bisphosphoglycerate-independent phosphoglycerate mutase
LGGKINDTDSQHTGVPDLEAKGEDTASQKTAKYVNEFLARAKEVLKKEHPANYILARGFAKHEPMSSMQERYGLRCAAVAQYPMYRGLARLVGMDVLPIPKDFNAMFSQIKDNYVNYDFFFVHFKKTDSYGEDGNFDAKVKVIESVDTWVKQLDELNPEVTVITGDHSTPAVRKSHSWHPVPVLLHARNGFGRPDQEREFGESFCARGGLGRMPMKNIILEALATAEKIQKFGA